MISWLLIFFSLEMGFYPTGHTFMYEPESHTRHGGGMYSVMNVEFEFQTPIKIKPFIGGELDTDFFKETKMAAFYPNGVGSLFFVGLRYRGLEFGFRHYCKHPVTPWMKNKTIVTKWESAFQQIYFRFDTRLFEDKE